MLSGVKMMCLLHQKKLLLCVLFFFIVVGSYMMHLRLKNSLLPKDKMITLIPSSSVTERVPRTTQFQEELTKPNRLLTKPSKPITKPIKPITKPAKTTEPDFFGDRYTIEDYLPHTNCPNSIREKMLQTDFGKKFLANVSILQWAKHFSDKEYERLRSHFGAHGWGSVSIDVLKKSLFILNTSANHLMLDDWEMRQNGSQCIRCAVVGNGGILNGSGKGREIDQNHYVFRTNGAIFKGFEDDVGSRTSFYTFSTNTLRNSLRTYRSLGFEGPPKSKETKYIFLPDHDRDYILMKAAVMHTTVDEGPEKGVEPKQYFGDDMMAEKFKMYHPDFIRYLRNRFLHSRTLNTKYKNIYRPSTGAVMLLAALHACDEVNAYGFITPDYKKYSDHYYDKSYQTLHFYANHDMEMELNLWQQLHNAKLINLYMRK